MQDKNEIIKNCAGIIVSTGLAITTQGSSSLILGALGGIATGIASNYIGKLEYSKIKNLLKDSDPSNLNHDLQKIIVQSVEWAVLNIQILYKKEGLDKLQKNELSSFIASLIEEVKVLNDSLSEKKDGIYNIIQKPKNQQILFKTFDLNVDNFPIIKTDQPFKDFFKKHFTANLQLCFGELLKIDKNKPALIAYQREVYQSLDKNISKVISQNEKILQKLTNANEKEATQKHNIKWRNVKKKIKDTSLSNITSEFKKLLDTQLTNIKQDTELLVDITNEIKDEVEKVKGITKGFSKELKQNWIAKNKVWILSLFAIAILSVSGLIYKINTTPFTMKVGAEIDKIIKVHSEYPKLSKEARVRFDFPETIEKEITFTNEVSLTEIPWKLKNTKCKVSLIDKYWEFTTDSILINNTTTVLTIRPNNRLATLTGKVITDDLQTLIKDALINVDGLQTKTDNNGEFILQIPIELRKINYSVRVSKKGYQTTEKYGVPGDKVEIRISKID